MKSGDGSIDRIRRLQRLFIGLTLWSVMGTVGCSSTPLREVAQPRASRGDQEFADNFVTHWNQNAQQIQSVVCRAVDVSGQSDGQSYTLDAMLAFKEPNDFRLTGKFLGKPEADLGSNGSEVWFWMARAQPPAVYFCKREDLQRVTLPMPFHPDDLMQVLGSVPIDPQRFRFEKGWDRYVTLVSSDTAPTGDPVVKRVVVDRATGRAAAFEVWDLYGQQPRRLAEARIVDYHEDPSGVFVPRKVKLVFPAAQTDLTLTLRSRAIEINQIDPQWASTLFSRGNYLNSQVVDLGEEYRRRQASLDQRPLARNPDIIPTASFEVDSTPPSTLPQRPAFPASDPLAPQPAGDDRAIPRPFEGLQPGEYRPSS